MVNEICGSNLYPKRIDVMNKEMKVIVKNNTLALIVIPQYHNTIDVKLVFNIKLKLNSEVNKYKLRLVAKGIEHQPGYNY